ncbi:glycosyltransferase [Ancylobacter sp. WKF20]|uniref:glycosyltransferase n=1 Tax=Ancylobacter sp. WKF20 TaxID=3039801 RepID=UPI0024345004|nr:glycosyltransferase [Ancylobacter sp. WKF20]WGD32221.1 glycosyltransferase [Ancylobacter sp. WKF20]
MAVDVGHSMIWDVLLDATAMAAGEIAPLIHRLIEDECLSAQGQRVTIACPVAAVADLRCTFPGFSVQGCLARALAAALSGAGQSLRPLAIVQGGWSWSGQTIRRLLDELRRDPMIASAQPRFVSSTGDRVLGCMVDQPVQMPVAAARYLPEYYITRECLSPLMVLSAQAVVAAPRPTNGEALHAYAEVLSGLRRRGYRNLLANRILVPWTGKGLPSDRVLPALAHEDADLLRDIHLEQPELKLERVLSRAFTAQGRPKILIDARGMQSMMNGTAVCTLGFLSGFQELAQHGASISVVAAKDAALSHRLAERFPALDIQHDEPKGYFMAMVLMNQPWDMDSIRAMHDCAAVISANMLDTIMWDIMFTSKPGLRQTWSLFGQCTDILFFNSAYSRDRYSFRFQPDTRIPKIVTHHSMSPNEIARSVDEDRLVPGKYVLVMGSDYEHKDIPHTLEMLSDAFPYLTFVSVGDPRKELPNVISYSSGSLPEETIANLYKYTEAVVFPSHYEGFGLPVAEALAYGKCVIVRKQPLWDEIRSISARPDSIRMFQRESDLVKLLGEIINAPEAVPPETGVTAGNMEPRWIDCARAMLSALDQAIAEFDGRRWMFRNDILYRN